MSAFQNLLRRLFDSGVAFIGGDGLLNKALIPVDKSIETRKFIREILVEAPVEGVMISLPEEFDEFEILLDDYSTISTGISQIQFVFTDGSAVGAYTYSITSNRNTSNENTANSALALIFGYTIGNISSGEIMQAWLKFRRNRKNDRGWSVVFEGTTAQNTIVRSFRGVGGCGTGAAASRIFFSTRPANGAPGISSGARFRLYGINRGEVQP